MKSAKIYPVLDKSEALKTGDRVRINNQDDDMHNKKGIFKGHHPHKYGLRTLIVLDESNKNIYVLPGNVEKILI